MPGRKHVYIQIFRFIGFSAIEIREFNKMKKNMVKFHITSITPVLQDFADFFSISLDFNMFSALMLVKVKFSRI